MWPQFFRTEAPVEWMIYLLLGSLGTRICRIGGVLVNDLKLDFWLSLESMSSSHGHLCWSLLTVVSIARVCSCLLIAVLVAFLVHGKKYLFDKLCLLCDIVSYLIDLIVI
ncbi:hypothetical protein CMV_008893 [Castanea mollissima]|uniref:Uncharacterized protein n=1 Tax=Castanea mollissima TaxID=60419 RepID=A0A8J4VRH2_9ROSI|nr:hypothetical protein CMV_008893 [Castanea mollissima]